MSQPRPTLRTGPVGGMGTGAALPVVLALLSVFAPLGTNAYLPALSEIGGAFGVDLPRIQLSVAVFLLGLGLGQFCGAPASDRHGRRPTALAGTAIAAASTVGILLCRSADQFIALRLAQGFGGGVAVVNIGAVVGDLFDTPGAARMLSVVGLVQAVARLAAPFVGAALLAAFGWRSIFGALLAYCAFLGLLLWLKLPETVPPAGRAGRPSIVRSAIRGYGRVLGRTRALGYAACLCFSSGCLFVVVTDAAFIYMDWFGLGAGAFGGLLALNGAAMALCTILNVRLLDRHPAHRIVRIACGAQCLAAGALLGHVALATPSLPLVSALIAASMGLAGVIIANAGACFLAYFPDFRATAAGVAGSIQFVAGGVLGTALSVLHTGTLATTAIGFTLCACAAAAALTYAKPRAGIGPA
ncbi:MAG: multidrug effflux MFS transporter [Gemmatimonadetes bacterium]|nr:multidrug effflux MFS transporter [Gemmatimonadota bacterium]